MNTEEKEHKYQVKYEKPEGHPGFEKLCGCIDTDYPVDCVEIKHGRQKMV